MLGIAGKRKDKHQELERNAGQKQHDKEKVKVRLFDRYGNQPIKFPVFVNSKDGFLEDTAEKIKKLFGGSK